MALQSLLLENPLSKRSKISMVLVSEDLEYYCYDDISAPVLVFLNLFTNFNVLIPKWH